MARDGITLDDKYTLAEGRIYLSGIQALVRLPLLQRSRDAAVGLNTAGFVSGYRGSPLAGLDQQLWKAAAHLETQRIVFQPGLNEELAATAVWGSQQTGLHAGARYDGIFALWYGKAPGVDRAADALRHANASGTSPRGGVLLVAGDDHACKSSSYPTQSEFILQHLEIPVLAPASVQDVLDYGLFGWAMSRYSGLWVSLIALTDLMDGSAVVEVGPQRPVLRSPRALSWVHDDLHIRSGDTPRIQEVRVREQRLPAALDFARVNQINRVVFQTDRPRLCIVASGKGYADTRQALADLGVDAAAAHALGIRVVKIGMPWPLDAQQMSDLLRGAERVLVVEEKRPFIESRLKEVFYDQPAAGRPAIHGKHAPGGAPLLAQTLELDAHQVARAIVSLLPEEALTERMNAHLAADEAARWAPGVGPTETRRTPFFCSGCPHNRSTQVPEGSRALVGIGCHYMVQWMDRESDHFSQMGGEGVAWLGQAPFKDERHVFANLGDGTYYHSGILAVRAAVAAGVNITYKLLYNGAVAMTGGQPVEGQPDVPQITRQLAAEGVGRIVVVSAEPERFGSPTGMAPGVCVHPRERLGAVQAELRTFEGVSVLIYDQECAAERRRKRKRKLVPDPERRIFINELVCEGCGDCSAASNCLSVEPVETRFGRKRRINQSSCNKDWSCVEGNCPAFVSVIGGGLRKRVPRDVLALLGDVPEPSHVPVPDAIYDIVLAGVGGTGVTTVSALLGMAAHIEGRASGVLDMTGLAQKGGAVMSHVRLAEDPSAIHGSRIPERGADLFLGCDLVVSAGEDGLCMLGADRTRTVLNTHLTATAAFVMDNDVRYDVADMTQRVKLSSRVTHQLDGIRIAEGMLGDSIGSNLLLLGFAYQQGWIPLLRSSIERAIELNGVAIEMNQRAFALGRLAAHDRKLIEDWTAAEERPRADQSLDDMIRERYAFLTAYQDRAYADAYRALVERVKSAEAECVPGEQRLTRAVARQAFRLMAYKDEYEVARLHADPAFADAVSREFEGDYRLAFHLAPPSIAKRDPGTGRLRKRRYGHSMMLVFRLLASARRLRGTWLDPFARQADRKLDRKLLADYRAQLDEMLEGLDAGRYTLACQLAELPEQVKGFDVVRARTAADYERERERLLARWRRAPEQGQDVIKSPG